MDETEGVEEQFSGWNNSTACSESYPVTTSLPHVAYSDINQGRTPAETFIGAAVAYGHVRGEFLGKHKTLRTLLWHITSEWDVATRCSLPPENYYDHPLARIIVRIREDAVPHLLWKVKIGLVASYLPLLTAILHDAPDIPEEYRGDNQYVTQATLEWAKNLGFEPEDPDEWLGDII